MRPDDGEWSTRPKRSPGRERVPWWKDYVGEACPHELRVVLVDGTHVRNEYDSNFVPKGEI